MCEKILVVNENREKSIYYPPQREAVRISSACGCAQSVVGVATWYLFLAPKSNKSATAFESICVTHCIVEENLNIEKLCWSMGSIRRLAVVK